MFSMPLGIYHATTCPYSPFWFVFSAPSAAAHLHSLFFGLDLTDILGSFEGCDGGAVIKVSPIAREFLFLVACPLEFP